MNKINQSNIVLLMVAIAMIIKGVISNYGVEIYIIAFVLILFSVSRMFIFKKALSQNLNYKTKGDDIIQKYFKQDIEKYIDMLHVYGKEYVDIVYDQNDGVCLYDSRNKIHYASALTKNACVEIMEKIQDDYEVLYTYDDIFDSYNFDYALKDDLVLNTYQKDVIVIEHTFNIIIKKEKNQFVGYNSRKQPVIRATLDGNKIESYEKNDEYKDGSEVMLKVIINYLKSKKLIPYIICEEAIDYMEHAKVTKYTHKIGE